MWIKQQTCNESSCWARRGWFIQAENPLQREHLLLFLFHINVNLISGIWPVFTKAVYKREKSEFYFYLSLRLSEQIFIFNRSNKADANDSIEQTLFEVRKSKPKQEVPATPFKTIFSQRASVCRKQCKASQVRLGNLSSPQGFKNTPQTKNRSGVLVPVGNRRAGSSEGDVVHSVLSRWDFRPTKVSSEWLKPLFFFCFSPQLITFKTSVRPSPLCEAWTHTWHPACSSMASAAFCYCHMLLCCFCRLVAHSGRLALLRSAPGCSIC